MLSVAKGSVITFKSRKDLKRSADEGLLSVLDVVRKQHRSIHDLLDEEDDEHIVRLLEDSPELGKGTYGEAHQLASNVVAKITGCPSGLLGDVETSPWRAENVEPKLLEFLWNHLVETHVTPHLIAPLGGRHGIINGATKKQQEADKEMTNSLVYFMEKATLGTVRSFLKELRATDQFDLVFRVILFQVCYTLEVIYKRFPTFRHNDLKDDNIMLHKSSSEGFTEYTIHGKRFLVPNVGVTVLISDFDFACISGYMFDNYKVIEQEWETPSYNINTRKDHAADFGCLITYLRILFSHKLSRTIRTQLEDIFGAVKKTNAYRVSVYESGVIPTTEQILTDTNLFDTFSSQNVKYPVITDSFNGDKPTKPDDFKLETRLGGIGGEKRCVPVIFPRQRDTLDMYDLPSYQYFRQCAPLYKYIDQDEPTNYSEQKCRALLENLEPLYDVKPDFGFDQEKKDEFYELVDQIGSSFIMDYFVPERWWPAAFTCAFIDAVEEMNLARPDQVCWYLEKWAKFWERQGVVRYANMQLLHFTLQWGWLRALAQ
jgi:serine/threonine protein kinase